jgi:hypothetical protein
LAAGTTNTAPSRHTFAPSNYNTLATTLAILTNLCPDVNLPPLIYQASSENLIAPLPSLATSDDSTPPAAQTAPSATVSLEASAMATAISELGPVAPKGCHTRTKKLLLPQRQSDCINRREPATIVDMIAKACNLHALKNSLVTCSVALQQQQE